MIDLRFMLLIRILLASIFVISCELVGAASQDQEDTYYAMASDFLRKAQETQIKRHNITKKNDGIYHGPYGEKFYIKAVRSDIYEENSPQEAAFHALFQKDKRVIPIYAHIKSDGYHFIVTKRAPIDLDDYLEDNYWTKGFAVPEEKIREIFLQILDIVEMVHSKELCYHDFKEENFVVLDNGRLALIDFGSASQMTKTFSEEVKGTLFYLSPEKAAFMADTISGYFPQEADIWSIGIILYKLMNRNPPFYIDEGTYDYNGAHQLDVLARISSEKEADLIETIYEEDLTDLKNQGIQMETHSVLLYQLMIKLLNKNSGDRITTTEEIRNHPWIRGSSITPAGGCETCLIL